MANLYERTVARVKKVNTAIDIYYIIDDICSNKFSILFHKR